MQASRYESVSGKAADIDHDLIEQMHTERKRCFVDELHWKLKCDGNLEIDEFDRIDTEYVIVTDYGKHAASLRLHKNSICKSLMSRISESDYESCNEIWELSRFISSNLSFLTSEYILILSSYRKLIKIGTKKVFATIDRPTARRFRILGVDIRVASYLPCKRPSCDNFVIKTDLLAYHQFCRRIPPRHIAAIRTLDRGSGKDMSSLRVKEDLSLAG